MKLAQCYLMSYCEITSQEKYYNQHEFWKLILFHTRGYNGCLKTIIPLFIIVVSWYCWMLNIKVYKMTMAKHTSRE